MKGSEDLKTLNPAINSDKKYFELLKTNRRFGYYAEVDTKVFSGKITQVSYDMFIKRFLHIMNVVVGIHDDNERR